MPLRHVLESQQFDRPFLDGLFKRAEAIRTTLEQFGNRALAGRFPNALLYSFFYEASTRTRFSFESAAHSLGMRVVSTENAKQFSSAAKGEILEDTIRVLSGYGPDVIVLRHYETGSCARAAAVSAVPIINAGDGIGEHPTQALLDLFTILRERGAIDGVTIAVGGDLLRGRTVHSLVYLLGKFEGVRIVFVAPPELRIGQDITAYLIRRNVEFREDDEMDRALAEADVFYWTRIQDERGEIALPEGGEERFAITPEHLRRMQAHAVILHPLPRRGEIAPEVDLDPRAAYFRQAANGKFIRAALLEWVLEGEGGLAGQGRR